MDHIDHYLQTVSIEPYFVPEHYFISSMAIFEFSNSFQSLQRYWEFNKLWNKDHISKLIQAKHEDAEAFSKKIVYTEGTEWFTPDSAEWHDLYSETAEVDIDNFQPFLRLSILSYSLSLIEHLLGELAEEIVANFNIEIKFEKKPLPWINKYILWLTRGCGMEVPVTKETWKKLDAIRTLRNRYTHHINKDIPSTVVNVINSMVSDSIEDPENITDEFIDNALIQIANLAKTIEVSYIKFYRSKEEEK